MVKDTSVWVRNRRFHIEENVLDLSGRYITQIAEIRGLEDVNTLRELDLSDNYLKNLEGLPPLPQLRRLDLAHNRIWELAGIQPLPRLEYLDLAYNEISFPRVTEDLKTLTTLKHLDLTSNKISLPFEWDEGVNAEEPTGLEPLSNLEVLYLANNQIYRDLQDDRRSVVEWLANHPHLGEAIQRAEGAPKEVPLWLRLYDERRIQHYEMLGDEIDWFADYIRSVWDIAVRNGAVILNCPCEFGFYDMVELSETWSKEERAMIRKLKLRSCGLRGLYFEGFPNIEILDLSQNKISDEDLRRYSRHFKFLPKLRLLNLAQNRIEYLRGFEHLTNLEELNLAGNWISEVWRLAKLPHLQYLDLAGNYISDLRQFASFPHLKWLNLVLNNIADLRGIDALAHLELLDLSGNPLSEVKELPSYVFTGGPTKRAVRVVLDESDVFEIEDSATFRDIITAEFGESVSALLIKTGLENFLQLAQELESNLQALGLSDGVAEALRKHAKAFVQKRGVNFW